MKCVRTHSCPCPGLLLVFGSALLTVSPLEDFRRQKPRQEVAPDSEDAAWRLCTRRFFTQAPFFSLL